MNKMAGSGVVDCYWWLLLFTLRAINMSVSGEQNGISQKFNLGQQGTKNQELSQPETRDGGSKDCLCAQFL